MKQFNEVSALQSRGVESIERDAPDYGDVLQDVERHTDDSQLLQASEVETEEDQLVSPDDAAEQGSSLDQQNDSREPQSRTDAPSVSIDTLQPRQAVTATPEADAAVTRLNERYAWIESSGDIFRFAHNDFVKPSKFHLQYSNEMVEAEVGGKLKARRISSAWLSSPNRRHHKGVVYAPGEPQVSGNNVNLWRGWGCDRKAGDITPWHNLLNYVFGEGDEERAHRKWFEQWVAYPFQKPGTKLNTAVVLWSARQGVGKTLLCQTIGRIYGARNYKEVTSRELRGRFNGWTKSCQFVLGEENSGASRLTDSDRLKHLITGETIQVNEKFQPLLEIQNCINFLFTSNHANAFFLESFDRRYFVWEIQGQPLPASFYANFVDWRDKRGGSAALMHHFQMMNLSEFEPKGHAPMTPAKAAMIDASRSDLEQWLGKLREDPGHAVDILGKEVITLEELAETYCLREKSKARPQEVGRAMHRLGECVKRRVQLGVGNRPMLHAVTRVEYWKDQDGPAWAEEFGRGRNPSTAPIGVSVEARS